MPDGGLTPHQRLRVLLDTPADQFLAAASFPIVQEDEQGRVKLRRGKDWRCSGHNAAMEADDVPTHHTVGDFVDLARRLAEDSTDLLAFGHDMLNAYRQWPVRRPEHCATFLPTAAGVTLWMHMAMCFGAAASVWNFNRAGGAVQLVVRAPVLLLGGHYVDDFNAVDFDDLADSAFETFGGIFGDLGLQTKPSKAQPPAKSR